MINPKSEVVGNIESTNVRRGSRDMARRGPPADWVGQPVTGSGSVLHYHFSSLFVVVCAWSKKEGKGRADSQHILTIENKV